MSDSGSGAAPRSERVFYMDLARGGILLTGVLLHAALVYQDKDRTLGLDWFPRSLEVFLLVVRRFRMEALFVVSGFFSAVLVESRGSKGFFRNRTVRMGVPFLFCGLLFNPIGFYLQDPAAGLPWSDPTFLTQGRWVDHLWNISVLLVFETCVFTLLSFAPAIHGRLARFRIPLPAALLGYLVLTVALKVVWDRLPQVPGSHIFFYPSLLPQFAPSYLLGYLVHRNPALREQAFDLRRSLPAALALLAAGLVLARTGHVGRPAEILLALERICWACSFFALVRILESRNRWIKRISIASYTIYLLHLPLQIALVAEFPALRSGWAAFATVVLVPVASVWLFHALVVERVGAAGFLFNGKVYDRNTRSF